MPTSYPYYTAPQFYSQPRYGMLDQSQPQIKGRPVTSIEEVKATTIDFDGSIFYFPDLANKKIYTKQINFDGTSIINTYELLTTLNNSQEQFVTRDEFNQLITQLHDKFAGTEVQSATPQAIKKVEAATSTDLKQDKSQRPQFDF